MLKKQLERLRIMTNQLNLLYRKLMFYFSKKDIDAILKYDPLNILQEREKQ